MRNEVTTSGVRVCFVLVSVSGSFTVYDLVFRQGSEVKPYVKERPDTTRSEVRGHPVPGREATG